MITEITFREIQPVDWPEIVRIYQQGIETRLATFETVLPIWEHWDQSHLLRCRILAEVNGEVAGWGALSPVSNRRVYEGVAELTIYIANEYKGLGVGSALMDELIRQSERDGLWTLQSVVFPENKASIHLHERFGFRKVGFRERIGKLDGEWRDTWLYERRSSIIF